ncbi:MAG: PUA domain-containing protein, partial [Thermodesulfovibrionales bacterium]
RAAATRPKGALIIDDGAVKAIVSYGKSLLPSGISKVEGFFNVGDPVLCLDTSRKKIAKGIVNYSSSDIDRIKGKRTDNIESLLGYKYADEVVHRDNLALLL